jgi:hypothetical protein
VPFCHAERAEGSIRPHPFRGAPISGDWRAKGRRLQCVAGPQMLILYGHALQACALRNGIRIAPAGLRCAKRLKRRHPIEKEVFVSHPRRRAKAPSVVGRLISETNTFYRSISCIYPRFGPFRDSRFEALVSGANHAVFLAASETRAFFKRSRSFRPFWDNFQPSRLRRIAPSWTKLCSARLTRI